MRALSKHHGIAVTALALALTALPAFAAPNIQPRQEGNVTYLTGGIGQGEATALKSDASDYNLRVINSDQQGHYTADTDMRITSADGRQMITAGGTGPLFYAQLPPGTYKVEATNGAKHWERVVKVGDKKPADLHIVWGGNPS